MKSVSILFLIMAPGSARPAVILKGGHINQLAYDFAVYFGDTVCCMRSGIVKELREDQPDNGGAIAASNHNYLMIQHEDGTVAFMLI